MIRYSLKCRNDHGFESWFQSAGAYDSLKNSGMISCPECGDTSVEKTLMAPQVQAGRKRATEDEPSQPVTNAPNPELAEVIQKLRDHVEKNSEYVGDRFATEARAMHEGDVPHRAIYGEVRPEEARQLAEDGVPALPLPFIPRQKTN